MKTFDYLYEEVNKPKEGEKKRPVTVSSSSADHYEYVHGRRPTGKGSWIFSTEHPIRHDMKKHDAHVVHNASYVDAKKQAIAHYKKQGHSGEIHVLT